MDERARSYLRTLVFAAALGLPVAFAAVLFQSALHHATDLVWEEIPHALDWSEPAWWYVVLVPGLAGVLVAAAMRLPGHGGHSPLEGLGLGPTPLIELPSILLAAFATLALGLVLGPRLRSSHSASASDPSRYVSCVWREPKRSCSSSQERSQRSRRCSEVRSSPHFSSSRSR